MKPFEFQDRYAESYMEEHQRRRSEIWGSMDGSSMGNRYRLSSQRISVEMRSIILRRDRKSEEG